jgi:pimeloyl-ACP methyl ester carboxylesterase/predicted glycosyltransferase
MRAIEPGQTGTVDRAGVPIRYDVYGDGGITVFLVPPAPITHSRIWKAQVPHLARRYRVVTFDGRGNGRSGQPTDPAAYTRAANVEDMVAVLDATETDTAVIVGHCHANWWSLDLATRHPDRVRALVAIAPGVPRLGSPQPHWVATADTWDQVLDEPEGWQLFNRHVITTAHRRWIEFFFASQLVEPHSTKVFDDAVAWALESSGPVLAASEEPPEPDPPDLATIASQCRALDVPVLVIHGDLDVCQHVDRGRALAELTGGELLVVDGGGHLTHVRDPIRVNRTITSFIDRTQGEAMRHQTWTRGASRRRRKVLYASSPIGLGHARRDLAIAEELRRRDADIEIEWLAQHPVTTVLEDAGEHIHPASAWLASESAHMASEAAGHDLHCFHALRNMDEILVANFMVFQEVVEDGLYDLVIGDEAWDIDHFWHENPELKRGEHVWLTDFVGFLPMPDGGDHEAFLTADYNAEMIEHIERFPRIRDRSIFVGNPDDIVPEVFGPGLPKIRDWTEAHFAFSGYITGFDPPTEDQRAEWRAELGYGEDELVCLVTVGGSGVGRDLLEKAIDSLPLARRQVPGLRMVAVTGPRIDPASLPRHDGLDVLGYVDRLYRHLAVCDLAVVQGGLTTTMELAAAQRPFLYFPLSHHFEQNFHVRHRLDQYGAGTHMEYATTDADALAEAISVNVGRPVASRAVETDGAHRAASLIAELL